MKTKWIALITLMLIVTLGCSISTLPTTIVPNVLATATPAPTSTVESQQPVQLDTSAVSSETLLAAVQDAFRQIYRNVNPSVVYIEVTIDGMGAFQSGGVGSGFVWDTQGHIVTNNHVIEGASQITVTFADGSSYEAQLIGTDSESDLAVIKVNAPVDVLRPVTIGDSRAVQVGDMVIAIGNPYGETGTMTQGIISALSRALAVDSSSSSATGNYTIPDIIQTDTAINPGNSGGVLLNMRGEVIGVTAAIRSSTDSNSGIGYVIPSHIVQKVVPVLIEVGSYQHPRIGISGVTLTSRIAQELGLDDHQRGVLVVTITPNGPAESAGLIGTNQAQNQSGEITYSGGDVILAIDGQPINVFEDLTSYLFNYTEVGQKITLTILRDGSEISVELTLGVITR